MWEATILHLHTDSACVHKWITDTFTGKARVRTTRAASEMLIRRRLDALASLFKEYGLSVDAFLVRSEQNRVDSLTKNHSNGLILSIRQLNLRTVQVLCRQASTTSTG